MNLGTLILALEDRDISVQYMNAAIRNAALAKSGDTKLTFLTDAVVPAQLLDLENAPVLFLVRIDRMAYDGVQAAHAEGRVARDGTIKAPYSDSEISDPVLAFVKEFEAADGSIHFDDLRRAVCERYGLKEY